jgi:hypothetical protein
VADVGHGCRCVATLAVASAENNEQQPVGVGIA